MNGDEALKTERHGLRLEISNLNEFPIGFPYWLRLKLQKLPTGYLRLAQFFEIEWNKSIEVPSILVKHFSIVSTCFTRPAGCGAISNPPPAWRCWNMRRGWGGFEERSICGIDSLSLENFNCLGDRFLFFFSKNSGNDRSKTYSFFWLRLESEGFRKNDECDDLFGWTVIVFLWLNHSLGIIALLNLYAYSNCKWRLTPLAEGNDPFNWLALAIPNQQPMKGDEYET